MTRRSIWLAILAQAFAAQCSNDSCLSAIRNAPTGRNATADCLSFLELQASPTGTPIRRTTTTTVTSTKSVATLTLHRSATITAQTRKTSSITSETDDSGNHKRAAAEDDFINRDGLGSLLGQALQEPRVTTSPTPTTLPLYATECASEADYSSACSSCCLALSHVAKAAAQPVNTKTVANVTLPPFFATSTHPAGNGTGTIGSTIYTGKTGRKKTSSTRPTTLFTSRPTSSKGASSGSELSSVSRTSTLSGSNHVVTIAALTTTKQPIRVNTKSTLGQITGKTIGAHYTNSTAALATASANITSSSWLNATTSAKYPIPVNSTASWYNGTSASLTMVGTGTGIGTGILVTGTGYYNTSTPTSTSTSTLSASPTATEDLTCGETTTPFSVRVSQPGGTFNNRFVHVVGNGLLFTSSQSQASSFSVVEGTGHLCAVGYNDSNGKPRIAAVASAGGTGDGTGGEEGGEGPVWMLRQGTSKAFWEDYKALELRVRVVEEGGLGVG
ncbi:hypothetical protein QBC45DRAFT_440485 [Copromyces sp. CBS 386.78]|nr:hypothetical protein QBC45DRAFT_440485 [Copromyces sp. CBS 386.78]